MSFGTVEQGHSDIVLAVDFDFYGERMVTASSDHKLRVWDRKGDDWVLLDTWRAHDAEIVDVKWNGPFWGTTLASIAEDGRCKLFQEDPTEIPKSGRRFKVIWQQKSHTNIPFLSLDFKNLPTENYLALTTRDGYLSVLEPVNTNNLNEWQSVDSNFGRYLSHTPLRSEETGFRVTFHKEESPSWAALASGIEHRPISLAVAAMNKVLIFRTDSQRKFYLAAELRGTEQIIRDVAWANGSMRGFDVIATASKDGYIRVYEVALEKKGSGDQQDATKEDPDVYEQGDRSSYPDQTLAHANNKLSGISAGLHKTKGQVVNYSDEPSFDRPKEVVTLTWEKNLRQGAVWRVVFSQNGQVLASTGDDGAVRTWKRSLTKEWLEYAEVEVSDDT